MELLLQTGEKLTRIFNDIEKADFKQRVLTETSKIRQLMQYTNTLVTFVTPRSSELKSLQLMFF